MVQRNPLIHVSDTAYVNNYRDVNPFIIDSAINTAHV